MEWIKRIGWGALIWTIIFMWATILMFAFKLETGLFNNALVWVGAIIAVWFIAGAAKVKNLADGVLVGLIFVAVGLLLDWLVTTHFNSQILLSYSIWVGYGLTFLVVVIKSLTTKNRI